MISFIAENRDDLGVEPICKVLPIAQSTFYAHQEIIRNPDLASDRAKRDADLSPEVKRIWEQNNEVYGILKVFAIGLERMATRCQTINYSVRSSRSRAVLWLV